MINTSELRLGNYVDIIDRSQEIHMPLGTLKRVSRIGLFNVELDGFSVNDNIPFIKYSNDICGIELTEEILFKCGFEKYGEYHDSYKNNPFIIELSILGESYRFRKMINANESILLKEIKYLHQLQNLYHSLTGKELIYNE